MYCQNLLEIALRLAEHDPTYEDLATKFFEHFALIASALNDKGLWDEEDGFYYDVLHTGDGGVVPLRARSIVGLLPLAAVTTLGPATMARLPDFTARVGWFTANRPEGASVVQHMDSADHPGWRMLSIVDEDAPAAAPRRDARPGRVPLRPRPARALEVPRGEPAARLDSTASTRRSTTSPASRRPGSSAATRTGAGRSGSRSTTC